MTSRGQLVFATRNPGKVIELQTLLADVTIDVMALGDPSLPPVSAVIEDADTFAGNAAKKARAVHQATGLPALADDSGLEVDALGGGPGVHSARYAGVHGDDQANNIKLVAALTHVPTPQRTARFRAALALADGDTLLTSEGTCEGLVLSERRGTGGFGYDPLFYSPELGMSFAEAGIGKKASLSHRARAMAMMKPQLIAHFRLAKPTDHV